MLAGALLIPLGGAWLGLFASRLLIRVQGIPIYNYRDLEPMALYGMQTMLPTSGEWNTVIWKTNLGHFFSSLDDNLTSETVAIKKIPGPFRSEEAAKRTYREVKLLRHLEHDNVRT